MVQELERLGDLVKWKMAEMMWDKHKQMPPTLIAQKLLDIFM